MDVEPVLTTVTAATDACLKYLAILEVVRNEMVSAVTLRCQAEAR